MRKADEIMTIFKKYGHELIDFEWGVYHATGRVKLRLKKSDFPTFDDAFLTRASKEKKSDLIYYHKDTGCRTEAHSKFYESKPFYIASVEYTDVAKMLVRQFEETMGIKLAKIKYIEGIYYDTPMDFEIKLDATEPKKADDSEYIILTGKVWFYYEMED